MSSKSNPISSWYMHDKSLGTTVLEQEIDDPVPDNDKLQDSFQNLIKDDKN